MSSSTSAAGITVGVLKEVEQSLNAREGIEDIRSGAHIVDVISA
jgi:hypothetical protein